MIAGLPLEYAATRTAARLAQRPSDAQWRHWHAARGLSVLLDAVRGSNAAPAASGVGAGAGADAIELAFRVQLRTRIAECAGWAPDEWRAAVLWTQRLVDLPLVAYLAAGGKAPGWTEEDSALAEDLVTREAAPSPGASRNPLPLMRARAVLPSPASAGEGTGVRAASASTPSSAAIGEVHLHRTLLDWLTHWRTLWPPLGADDRAALEALVATISRHLLRFGAAAPEDAAALRAELQTRLLAGARQHAARPVALFAALALHALDLERLRAEFLLRALFGDGAGEPQ